MNLLVIRIGGFEMHNEDFLGVETAVISCVNIASNTVIGSGATVIENTDNAGVYVGTPARRIKS